MARKWTKQELDFIVDNRLKLNCIEMSRFINRTQLGIGWKLRELGFHRPDKWIDEDTTFLKDNCLSMKPVNIAKHLNRTVTSIHTRLYELGLTRPPLKGIANIELTPSFAYFIGCLCGDASILSNKIRLNVKDKDFADEFYKHSKIVLSQSDINITRYTSIQKGYNYCMYNIQISSLGLREYLLKHYGTFKSLEWKIPDWILASNDYLIISSFLRGLFDSEGSFKLGCISLQTISPETIKVSLLLDKLRIKNRCVIVNRLTIKGNKVYQISITSVKHINLFKKKIGFSIQRKQQAVINYLIKHSKSISKTRLLYKNRKRMAELYKKGYTLQMIANKFNITSLNVITKYILKVLKEDYYKYRYGCNNAQL